MTDRDFQNRNQNQSSSHRRKFGFISRRQQACLLLQTSHIQRLSRSSEKVLPTPMKDKLESISPLPTQLAPNGEGLQIGPEGECWVDAPSLTSCLSRYHIAIFKELGLLDRLLTPLIILFMIIGVVIGEFAPHIRDAFDTVRFDSVSVRALFPNIRHFLHSDLKFSSHCRWSSSHDVAYLN